MIQQAAAAGWRAVHPKFHAGEQRTLFRPGKDEAFQWDHIFCDGKPWDAATACDVLHVPHQHELSDHAPLVFDLDGGSRLKYLRCGNDEDAAIGVI